MELQNLIKNNNIENYENLKNILESNPYNLKIKDDKDYPNLFLIHGQDNSDYTNKIVQECNGIIMNKNNLNIVCYSFDKCSDKLEIPENFNKDKVYFENAVEGTLMRLYFYNDQWIISTKKCIDANKAFWMNKRSFLELFKDCENVIGKKITEIDDLNKNYCYSFIIVHPENNIVIKYIEQAIFHIATRDMTSFNEIDQNIGINKLPRSLISNSINSFVESVIASNNTSYEGVVFIDENYNRWKLRTAIFNHARELWGNTNNRMFRYMELRKDSNLLHEYLMYFPYDRESFYSYEYKIKTLTNDILSTYINKHVLKTIDKVPFYYSRIIYKLHGDFFKTKIRTDFNKVGMALLEIDAKLLCFIMNHYEKSLLKDNSINDMNVDMNVEDDGEIITNVVTDSSKGIVHSNSESSLSDYPIGY